MTDMQAHVSLDEFVWRADANEFWSASSGGLWRIALAGSSADLVTTAAAVRHLNIVPPDGLLYAPPTGGTLHLFDLATQSETGTVVLPAPTATPFR